MGLRYFSPLLLGGGGVVGGVGVGGTSEMPLLTGQNVGKVGNVCPTFIKEAPMFQITVRK